MKFNGPHLGDFVLEKKTFSRLESVLKAFQSPTFAKLNEMQRAEQINRSLLELIEERKPPCFLLSEVVDFIDRIAQAELLEHYTFAHFEQWLNQLSNLTQEQNYKVRAKIIGRWVPREEYQRSFPIGMGKRYPGPHFVTAHSSPDLDTTVASFWGWIDAFAARVAEGIHLWNVPGGPSSAIEIEFLFYQIFGQNVFHHLAKTQGSLIVSSFDLLSQKGVVLKQMGESTLNIEHEKNQNAIILVDGKGYYLGEWRNFDVEGVRQVIGLLNHCLHWMENNLYQKLFSLFAKEKIALKNFQEFIHSILTLPLSECAPAKKFTERQTLSVQAYLIKILDVPRGLQSSFAEFILSMQKSSLFEFEAFIQAVKELETSPLFNRSGNFEEDRPLLFSHLEKVIQSLHRAIEKMDAYVDRLEISLKIKSEIFGHHAQSVSYLADSEEVRSKMKNYPYLTVTYTNKRGQSLPLGIIDAQDLYKPILGTVSLRDFCNREETKIPSYLEIISVIDHHKSSFNSSTPPSIWISDAQSSNALVAELSFAINDRYSTAGLSAAQIAEQIQEIENQMTTTSDVRILQRLLQKRIALDQCPHFYISPEREFIESLHFLYAILDDTDLLTKVSSRDVECVASLLNRLKTLMLKREVEVVHFDDLPRNETFAEQAAKRILQNFDMYSLYRKIYLAKEQAVEVNLKRAAKGQSSTFFSDTKEQNGCCRVGQTKLFSRNFAPFEQHVDALRQVWYEAACNVVKEKAEIDLHLQMISTIAGAEDLFAGTEKVETHQDEIWIWIPETETGAAHLRSFLNSFRALPTLAHIEMEVEFFGENAEQLHRLFKESFFPSIPYHLPKAANKELPIAVLRFKAGAINSRKAMISPYLPKLVS
jgi:hypothetical protein